MTGKYQEEQRRARTEKKRNTTASRQRPRPLVAAAADDAASAHGRPRRRRRVRSWPPPPTTPPPLVAAPADNAAPARRSHLHHCIQAASIRRHRRLRWISLLASLCLYHHIEIDAEGHGQGEMVEREGGAGRNGRRRRGRWSGKAMKALSCERDFWRGEKLVGGDKMGENRWDKISGVGAGEIGQGNWMFLVLWAGISFSWDKTSPIEIVFLWDGGSRL